MEICDPKRESIRSMAFCESSSDNNPAYIGWSVEGFVRKSSLVVPKPRAENEG